MANTAQEQAQSEMTDLFRLVIFHIPSIAGNQFVRTNIDKPSDNMTAYSHTHTYTEPDGSEYEIEVTLAVGYEVTRKGQPPRPAEAPRS